MTAPVWQPLPAEQRLLVSPAWFVLVDDFRRRPYAAGLAVWLDRWDRSRWVPTGTSPVITPSGVVAYPGLGRRREPWNAEPELYRARFAVAGYQPLYALDDALDTFSAADVGREFLAYPYDDLHPPQIAAEAEVVRLLPAVSFGYPPGTRVISGVVRRAVSGTPIGNAYVTAVGRTEPDGQPWIERTLTDAAGSFRLALRWAGETETVTVTAVERPEAAGRLTVRLPDELGPIHVIEISD